MKKRILLIALVFIVFSNTKAQLWNGTGPIWTNYNVGIGTTNSFVPLTIVGNTQGNDATITNINSNRLDWSGGSVLDLKFNNTQTWDNKANTAFQRFINNTSIVAYISTLGGAYFASNVGIGTTAPTYLLEVNGRSKITSISVLSSIDDLTNNAPWYGLGAISNNRVQLSGYYGLLLKSSSANIELFQNGNISLTGNNIGIGTTSPRAKLEIDGSLITGGSSFTSNAADWGIYQTVATAKNYFNGNVGIGTTTPNSPLTVVSSMRNLSLYSSNTSNNNAILFDTPNNAAQKIYSDYNGTNTEQALIIGTYNNRANQIYLATNGNVGIGTTNPNGRLDVAVSSGSQNTQYTNQSWSSGNDDYSLRLYTFWNGYGINQHFVQRYNAIDYNVLSFFAGNIGIGTTTPQNKLDVAGTIRCTEVKVVALPWPDFVFHPTYKLRTLGEVEQFIKTNNHLPEIPTESEVKENGVGLGEMNAKLLQKVEELTLYLIEQQKQTNEQQKQMLDQQKQINELKELNNMLVKEVQSIKK